MKIENIALLLGIVMSSIWMSQVMLAHDGGSGKREATTVKGEIVDLMCYLGHGPKGVDHARSAKRCIRSGGPVGLLSTDGILYLVIGNHKPVNSELAKYAGKTITLRGNIASRDGMNLLQNIKIISAGNRKVSRKQGGMSLPQNNRIINTRNKIAPRKPASSTTRRREGS